MDLQPGRVGTASVVVAEADTAAALGSGDVAVLGTPRLVALCEAATVAALDGALPADETSVGTRVEVDHLRPSRVGARVDARATLDAVEGRRLTFSVEVREADQLVGVGRISRAVVERARFD